MAQRIRFNKPEAIGRETDYLAQAMENARLAGDGPFTQRCQELLEELLGVPRVLITPSCTAALEMSALLLDLKAGDEVIIPSFTFVSTANAFVLRGATPIFADIRPDTLNIDESRLEDLVTTRTRAIVPVHYAGIGCAMAEIQVVADRHGLVVVEDNAHGLFGVYRSRRLGTFGSLATLSFHETKNFSCGEGGALLVNDVQLIDRAEILREKGTDRSRFFRGEIDKYTWRDIGSSFLLGELSAAYLFGQLERHVYVQAQRRRIWWGYYEGLRAWARAQDVQLPYIPEDRESAYHLFHLLMPDSVSRDRFIAEMKSRNIVCVFHYLPLHLSSMGRRYGLREGDRPVTESVAGRLVRLPFYTTLSPADQERVIEAALEFKI